MAIISGGTIIEGALHRVTAPTVEGAAAGHGCKVAFVQYDFATDAGAAGAVTLLPTTDLIPAGAVILGGFVEVITVPTSVGAATIAVHVEAANDIVTAAAISGAPWSTTGRKSVIPAFTGATSLKTTVARNITVTIAVEDLTAGKINVYLLYVETL